jgi:hypothetical protein
MTKFYNHYALKCLKFLGNFRHPPVFMYPGTKLYYYML